MTAADREETLRLHHRVEVIDGATGEPFESIVAWLQPGEWPHWVLKTRAGNVVLSTYDRLSADLPDTTTIELQISDPEAALRYAGGDAPIEVEFEKGVESPAEPVELAPVETALEVHLRLADGNPSTGLTVKATNTADASDEVTLAESLPGVYSTAPRAWSAQPYSLVIANHAVRSFLIDHAQPVTRLQFKYP